MRTEEDGDLLEYLGGYGGALVGGERWRTPHIRTTVGMSMYFGYGKRGIVPCCDEIRMVPLSPTFNRAYTVGQRL